MRIEVPELALVVLLGAAGAGKTTFARARFKPTEVVSSDACRALIADDEADQSATPAAFEVLHLITSLRLRRRRLTVIDAVNARAADRRPLLTLAREHDVEAIAMVFNLPESLCIERDRGRPGRSVGARVVRAQYEAIRRSLPGLGDEGFETVHLFDSGEDAEMAVVRRVPLPVNRRWERGPFDVIGDVHGDLPQLIELLRRLGYRVGDGSAATSHTDGRKAVLVGDLVGSGPDSAGVVQLVAEMAAAGSALCVRGDQDDGLARTVRGELPESSLRFLNSLPSHYVLAGGQLVVTHAAILPEMQGRDSARVRAFCREGQAGWQRKWRGRALVVHGHDPVPCAQWEGRTVNVDTGSVRGGRLTALRYPELQLVSI